MNGLLNFYQITELIGTSGQPTREQFSNIVDVGYKVVVNLGMPDSDNVILDEGNLVSSLGMSYVHIPVPFDAPSQNHLRQFFQIMDAFDGEMVFVHCVVNARVSAFMYQYLRLRKGLDAETSTTPLLEQWLPSMDEVWKSIINLSLEKIESQNFTSR